MKERPILFSGEMVRAILDGRKTVTRRLVDAQWFRCLDPNDDEDRAKAIAQCPYGVTGDRLWVRETFALIWPDEGEPDDVRDNRVEYRADKPDARYPGDWPDCPASERDSSCPKWRPSIHMPRWASRITLQITGVQLQRLHDMKERDALAEGIGSPLTRDCKLPKFRELWDELHGDRAPWASNPWVWVIGFERVSR